MRRIVFALFAILVGTAGIRAYSPVQVSNQQTRIAFLGSIHYGWSGGKAVVDSALARVYQMQPDAIFLVDDAIGLTRSGTANLDSLVTLYRTMIQAKSSIPVYGAINNWDYSIASVGATAMTYTPVHADSVDPLRYARQVIPQMDHYGNYYVDVKNTRVFCLNSCLTSLGDSCETNRRKFDPTTGYGTGFGGAVGQDWIYQPADMYSNWNSVTGPGYLFFKSAAQSCTLPHFILLAPNGFYGVQGDSIQSGVWCWNRAKVFMALLDTVTTAAGHKVEAVGSAHQHCWWHAVARHDSSIAYASGGIDHINFPPCSGTHSPSIAAQTYAGNIPPDTSKVDSVSRWQDHGGVNGALLVALLTSATTKYMTQMTRPAYTIYDASFTSSTWTTYDSSSVKDQWTRGVR